MKSLLITLILTLTLTATATEGWMTDYEKAIEKAAKENKTLIINFTGSDWCGWCVKLKKEVFNQEEFKTYASEKLVLLELDYPRKKKLPAELKAQNEKLSAKYKARSFPSILIIDAKGRPVKKTGYKAGGPEVYNKHLDELIAEKDEFIKAIENAETLKGAEKAVKLGELLKSIDPAYHVHYADLIQQIKAGDPEDQSGIVKKYETTIALNELSKNVNTLLKSKNKEGVRKAVDDFVTKIKPEGNIKQQVLFFKVYALPPAKTPADFDKINEVLDSIIEVNSKSRIAMQCMGIKRQISALKKKMENAEKK